LQEACSIEKWRPIVNPFIVCDNFTFLDGVFKARSVGRQIAYKLATTTS
jgi:hypothetical protein